MLQRAQAVRYYRLFLRHSIQEMPGYSVLRSFCPIYSLPLLTDIPHFFEISYIHIYCKGAYNLEKAHVLSLSLSLKLRFCFAKLVIIHGHKSATKLS